MHARRNTSSRGFGLAEAVVASGLLITLSAALAHLTAMTSLMVSRAATESLGLFLAVQKMEQLRSLSWGYASAELGTSARLSDLETNLASDQPTAGGPGLGIAPAGTLVRSTSGFVDHLDGRGRWIGAGTVPPAGTAYVRRWSVAEWDTVGHEDPPRVLQVVVMPLALANATLGSSLGASQPGVVWLATLKTRQ